MDSTTAGSIKCCILSPYMSSITAPSIFVRQSWYICKTVSVWNCQK